VKRHRTGEFEKKYVATMGVEVNPLPFSTSLGQIVYNCWYVNDDTHERDWPNPASMSDAHLPSAALSALLSRDTAGQEKFGEYKEASIQERYEVLFASVSHVVCVASLVLCCEVVSVMATTSAETLRSSCSMSRRASHTSLYRTGTKVR
jgi:hypothetical protein